MDNSPRKKMSMVPHHPLLTYPYHKPATMHLNEPLRYPYYSTEYDRIIYPYSPSLPKTKPDSHPSTNAINAASSLQQHQAWHQKNVTTTSSSSNQSPLNSNSLRHTNRLTILRHILPTSNAQNAHPRIIPQASQ